METKGKERALIWLKELEEGYSYQDIANHYGYSKNLIYLQLKKHFKEETDAILKARGRKTINRTKKDFKEIRCLNCGKITKTNYRYYEKKFCSKECRSEFTKTAFKMLQISKETYFDNKQ